MLLDERDENLVGQRTGLAELGIWTDDDVFLRHSPVEFNLLGVGGRPLGVVAEQRAGNAQQRIFHVELFCLLDRFARLRCPSGRRHTSGYYSGKNGRAGGGCGESRPAVGVACATVRDRSRPFATVRVGNLRHEYWKVRWHAVALLRGGWGVCSVPLRVAVAAGGAAGVAAVGGGDQERGKHGLEAMDERVGLLVALKERLDLRVFHGNLAAQKIVFLFEEGDVPVLGAANRGERSRLFVAVRPLGALIFHSANVRVCSRLVATSRDCSHLLDVGDVAVHGVRGDEVFFTGLGLDLVAIKL